MQHRFLSRIEFVGGLNVEGYAVDQDAPERVLTVLALENGDVLASARADTPRPDLKGQGIGSGHGGFLLRLPLRLADGREHGVRLCLEDGRELNGSPALVALPARGLRAVLRDTAEELARIAPEQARRLLHAADMVGRLEERAPQSLDFSDWPDYRALMLPGLIEGLRAGIGGNPAPAVAAIRPGNDPRRALEALRSQTFAPGAVVQLGGDAPLSPGVLHIQDSPAGLSQALEQLGAAPDTPVLLAEPGISLDPHALEAFSLALREHPLAYSDHEAPPAPGLPPMPRLKPAWDYDLFLSTGYTGGVLGVRAGLLSGLPDGTEWADLPLLLLERLGGRVPIHLPLPLWGRAAPDLAPALQAVRRHLARTAPTAQACEGPGGTVRVEWPLPANPGLTCVLPTKDQPGLLRQCLSSLRGLAHAAIPLDVVVVDNGSTLPEGLALLAELEATPGVHVVRAPGPFNYSRLVNAGAAHGAGSILALLNDDLLFPSDPSGGWLRHVLGHLSRPDVGVVGVKLLYPDGLVQHAGMTLGPDATAVHAFRHCAGTEPGYMGLAAAARQCSAVTGACLFTPRALFNRLGGLDEHELAVTFNDVDYCLRARQAGLRTVCTPYAWAWHLESASRGADESPRKLARASRELTLFAERWGPLLEDDPHYHPLLNRRGLPYLGLRFPLPSGGALGRPR